MRTGTITQAAKYDISAAIRRKSHDDKSATSYDVSSARNSSARNNDLCQEISGTKGSWIHAWLHRQEGDYGNACYWYDRAGKLAPEPEASLEEEWFEIATALTICR